MATLGGTLSELKRRQNLFMLLFFVFVCSPPHLPFVCSLDVPDSPTVGGVGGTIQEKLKYNPTSLFTRRTRSPAAWCDFILVSLSPSLSFPAPCPGSIVDRRALGVQVAAIAALIPSRRRRCRLTRSCCRRPKRSCRAFRTTSPRGTRRPRATPSSPTRSIFPLNYIHVKSISR